MTLKEIAYDIQKILTKHKITDDVRTSTPWLEYKINQYRAAAIEDKYTNKKSMNPSWLQEYNDIPFVKINQGEDPNVTGCDCTLGRLDIPTVVDLPEDKGVYLITSSCKTVKYYPITFDRFIDLVPGTIRGDQNYYTRIGFSVYIRPYIAKGFGAFVLEDPREGYIIKSGVIPSGNLVIGQQYEVISGRITHSGSTFQKGQTFTAISKNYTGLGIVRLANIIVSVTDEERYPMDHTLTEFIVMKILTQEFNIEMKMQSDNRNDATDETLRRD